MDGSNLAGMKLDCGHLISALSLSLSISIQNTHRHNNSRDRGRSITRATQKINMHTSTPSQNDSSSLPFFSCIHVCCLLLVYVLVFLFSNGFIATYRSLESEYSSFPTVPDFVQSLPAGASPLLRKTK